LNGFPSGSIKNFSKFHAISVLVTGSHIIDDGEFMKLTASSLGSGNRSLKNAKMGCAFLRNYMYVLFIQVKLGKIFYIVTYLKFSLFRIPFYSAFGLDRFH
jgi:hypothetical protein